MTETSEATLPNLKKADCTNCGVPLSGKFCHDCGQSSRSMIKFFGEVLKELMDDILGYDSRLKHSILPLLFKPGKLTLEYIHGRRFYYVMPFRLYLITSIIFIFIVQMNIDTENIQIPNDQHTELSIEDKQALQQDVNQLIVDLGDTLSEQKKQKLLDKIKDIDKPSQPVVINHTEKSATTTTGEGISNNKTKTIDEEKEEDWGFTFKDGKPVWLPRIIQEEGPMKLFFDEFNSKAPKWLEDPKPLFDELFRIAPYMMLFLIPIFAIFQKLFYSFSKRYYIEHLIFSLHNHSFLYITLLGSIATENATDSLVATEGFLAQTGYYLIGILDFLIGVWVSLYIFIATKRVYQQGWLLTISKTLVLGFLYFILIMLGMTSTILIGVYIA